MHINLTASALFRISIKHLNLKEILNNYSGEVWPTCKEMEIRDRGIATGIFAALFEMKF